MEDPHLQVPASHTLAVADEQIVVPHMQMPPLQVKPVPQFLMAHGSANKCERKSGMK